MVGLEKMKANETEQPKVEKNRIKAKITSSRQTKKENKQSWNGFSTVFRFPHNGQPTSNQWTNAEIRKTKNEENKSIRLNLVVQQFNGKLFIRSVFQFAMLTLVWMLTDCWLQFGCFSDIVRISWINIRFSLSFSFSTIHYFMATSWMAFWAANYAETVYFSSFKHLILDYHGI